MWPYLSTATQKTFFKFICISMTFKKGTLKFAPKHISLHSREKYHNTENFNLPVLSTKRFVEQHNGLSHRFTSSDEKYSWFFLLNWAGKTKTKTVRMSCPNLPTTIPFITTDQSRFYINIMWSVLHHIWHVIWTWAFVMRFRKIYFRKLLET